MADPAVAMPLCRACLAGHPVAHEALLDEIDQMLNATGRFDPPAWLSSASDTAPMTPVPTPIRSKGVAAPVSCPPQAAAAASLHLHEVT